tara:strand:+ start:126 stop:1376 length:1251 start_codon:yes stop_codon:yes gene_type:complete
MEKKEKIKYTQEARYQNPILILFLFLLVFFASLPAKSEPINVTYAGFSFSSNYIDIEKTGKYTNELLKKKNENGMDIISTSLLKEIEKARPKSFKINFDYADITKGSKESIAMTVSLINEDYSREYEPITKVYLNNIVNSYQILFYDFNSKKLLAAIPFDTELQFFSKKKLSDNEIILELRKFYSKGQLSSDKSIKGKINIFYKIRELLDSFNLKRKYKFSIGVTKVILEDKAKKYIPEKYQNNDVLKSIFAQQFSSKLALYHSIAQVPYNEGMSIGNAMKLQFVNSDIIYDIALPKPEFDIVLNIRGFKKVTAAQSDVRNIYLYGSYVKIKVFQKDLNKIYFDEKIKNASQVEIPNNIKNIDDWRRFYTSTIILFQKFSKNIKNPEEKWAKKAFSKDTDYKKTLHSLKGILEKTQ